MASDPLSLVVEAVEHYSRQGWKAPEMPIEGEVEWSAWCGDLQACLAVPRWVHLVGRLEHLKRQPPST